MPNLVDLILRNIISITVLFQMLICEGGGRVDDKNPPVAQSPVVRVVANIGEDVRISCPIDSGPSLYFEWSKKGQIIDYTWAKYKTHRKYLKIKSFSSDDSGIYICKGINGFGSTEVRVELYAADDQNTKGNIKVIIK